MDRCAKTIPADGLTDLASQIPDDYDLIAPIHRDWSVRFGLAGKEDAIVTGLRSEESPGHYRLYEDSAAGLDGVRKANSPKQYTFRPRELLVTGHTDGTTRHFSQPDREPIKQAFFGLSACDAASLSVMDRTFSQQRFTDPQYSRRRQENIVVAMNCTRPGANCFCLTFGTGPEVSAADVVLTFLGDRYLAEAGSAAGEQMIESLGAPEATETDQRKKETLLAAARTRMPKAFNLEAAVTTLKANYEHPYWSEPSQRCLSCANCINVCPTCYCYHLEDQSSMDGSTSERWRTWDACQHLEFAEVAGGNMRPNREDRLRQWVNHKLSWSTEQYGVPGCVGCGRCVTWCPTAIDITEPVWRIGGQGVALVQ